MKIFVKSDKTYVSLWLPLRLIASKIVWTGTFGNKGSGITEVSTFTKAQRKEVYEILKTYVKKHGHFTMVEVYSEDGARVKITI